MSLFHAIGCTFIEMKPDGTQLFIYTGDECPCGGRHLTAKSDELTGPPEASIGISPLKIMSRTNSGRKPS